MWWGSIGVIGPIFRRDGKRSTILPKVSQLISGWWSLGPSLNSPTSLLEHLGLTNMTAAVPGCRILRLGLWTFLSCWYHQPWQEQDSKHSPRLLNPPIFYQEAPWPAGRIFSNMGKFNRWFNLRFCENTLHWLQDRTRLSNDTVSGLGSGDSKPGFKSRL